MTPAINCSVVRAINQDDVYQAHANEQGNNTPEHYLVFPEEFLCAYPSSKHANEDGCESKDGAPPRDQESGIDVPSRLVWRRLMVVEGAFGQYAVHLGWRMSAGRP